MNSVASNDPNVLAYISGVRGLKSRCLMAASILQVPGAHQSRRLSPRFILHLEGSALLSPAPSSTSRARHSTPWRCQHISLSKSALPCPSYKEPVVASGHADNPGLLPLQVLKAITSAESLLPHKEHGHRCSGGGQGHPWGPLFCLPQGSSTSQAGRGTALGGAEEAQRHKGGRRSLWLHTEDTAGGEKRVSQGPGC